MPNQSYAKNNSTKVNLAESVCRIRCTAMLWFVILNSPLHAIVFRSIEIITSFDFCTQVCCNVTDLEKSISCVENVINGENKTVWTNIHVRNATIDELDISLKLWKLLDSLAITDGQVNRIVREFPKFSQPKCLNMSNNNLHTIPTRALKDLTRLQILDLSHNNLSTVPNLNNLNLALDVR